MVNSKSRQIFMVRQTCFFSNQNSFNFLCYFQKTLAIPRYLKFHAFKSHSYKFFRYDENWYLGESPQYGQPIILDGRSFNDGVELEISSQDNGSRQTVSRLQRMLQETDDRLEKLQTEVGEVTTGSTTTPSLPPGSYCPPTVPISSAENSSEQGTIHILRKHL